MGAEERVAYEVVADTAAGRCVDFRPYVPAINDDGVVAYQAALDDENTTINFTKSINENTNENTSENTVSGFAVGVGDVVSHPVINGGGQVCAFVGGRDGRNGLWRSWADRVDEGFAQIGPLGPTMNASGAIAFRAEREAGREGLFLVEGDRVQTVAEVGERFLAFQGLPVVNDLGQVAFRADLHGGQGVFLWEAGEVSTLVETGTGFDSLGNFPSLNNRGTVAFAASGGIFKAQRGEIDALIEDPTPFESFRGVLIDDVGDFVFYATPVGGQLGIYSPHEPLPILTLGDAFAGSTVAEFALNPVSMNNSGQIAVRVLLADDRQLILRINLLRRTLA